MGRSGSHPGQLQAGQVPGRDPAADGAPPARLRARSDQGEGARAAGRAAGAGARGTGRATLHRVRLRVLQHLALRLREAPRRRAAARREPPERHRRFQPEHARGAGTLRLRQHYSQARRGGAAVPGAGTVPDRRPAPGPGRQPHDGDDLRRAAPEVQRSPGREPGRALHTPRRGPPDGGAHACGRRARDRATWGGADRLRPLLRLGGHADDREGAHHRGTEPERRTAPAGHQPGGGHPPLRPGGESRDVGGVEVGLLHEGPGGGRTCLDRQSSC